MCFSVSLSATAQDIAHRYNGPIVAFSGGTSISAFTHPQLPVVKGISDITPMNWGLVPHWVKSKEQAEEIRKRTLNARAETLFEKPSFRDAIPTQRCLIPVTAFQEWHHNDDGSKTKYTIALKDEKIYSLAGIWSFWRGPQTGKPYYSYSIITCEANELMAEIHNTKKRMPVILTREDEERWLNPQLEKNEIQALLKPFDDETMIATETPPVDNVAHPRRG